MKLHPPVNEDYDPNDHEEDVLAVLKREGRANPYLIRDHVDFRKQYVNNALSGLVKAGWVRKVTDGLYEFVGDPREPETQTVEFDSDELGELVQILDRCDVAGASLWSDRLKEASEDAE